MFRTFLIPFIMMLLVGVTSPGLADDIGKNKSGSGGGGKGNESFASNQKINLKKVPLRGLANINQRIENAKKSKEIDDAITKFKEILKKLIEMRKDERNERQATIKGISDTKNQISRTKTDIARLEAEIASFAVGLIPRPDLAIMLSNKKKELSGLRQHHSSLESQLKDLNIYISEIDKKMKDVEKELQATRKNKELLQGLFLAGPHEGARLMIGSSHALLITSQLPPKRVRVRIEHRYEKPTLGSTPAKGSYVWKPVYDQTIDWNRLSSAGPNVVQFSFKTKPYKPNPGSNSSGIGLETKNNLGQSPSMTGGITFEGRGKYRAAVARADDENSALKSWSWRNFEVVGKVGSQSFKQRTPIRPPGIKPSTGIRPAQKKGTSESGGSTKQRFFQFGGIRSRGIDNLPSSVNPDPEPPALPNFELQGEKP
jgi:vacuolar-type H+-ATPase subunit D/Vma8